jgi:lactose/L-arabinose transport system substrate-binding protein
MKKMKRKIILLLSILIISSLLFAQGAKEEEEFVEGPAKLTVWGWDSSFNGYAMEEADKLDDSVEVEFVEMGKAAALQKLHTILASGATDNLPDIVLISDLHVKGYLMSYPDAFAPMDSVINYADFAPYKKEMLSYDGVGYGIPFDTGVTGLFYRTDYMEEIGVTKEYMDNLTWDQYLALGPKLKEKGHLLQTYNPNDIAEFQIMLQSAGSWFTDENGNADFVDNDALRECYRIFKQLNEANYTKVVSDWGGFAGAINGGEVATVMRGSWISSTIMNNPDDAGKWALAPIPRMDIPGAVKYSNQGGSSWFVLANAPHRAAAEAFMANTFAGSVELYDTLLRNKTILGTYLPANDAPAYDEGNPFYSGQLVNKELAQWAAKIPAVDTGAFSAEAQASLVSVTPRVLAGEDYSQLMKEAEKQFAQKVQ